jgi:hypothetical protein
MCAARDRVRVRRAGSGLDSTALASRVDGPWPVGWLSAG